MDLCQQGDVREPFWGSHLGPENRRPQRLECWRQRPPWEEADSVLFPALPRPDVCGECILLSSSPEFLHQISELRSLGSALVTNIAALPAAQYSLRSTILTILRGDHECLWASQMVLVVKNPPANAGDMRNKGLIHELERSPGGGHGSPL